MPKVKKDLEALKKLEKGASSLGKKESLSMEDLNIEFPSTTVIVAKKFSGKSNLIIDLINPDEFDNVFLITGTSHTNRLSGLVKSDDFILDNISDEFIRRLLEHQVENPEQATLLIFDDIIGLDNNIRKVRKMDKLGASGRNFNISMVISVQELVAISPTIRRNTEYYFFGNNFQGVIETIAKAFGSLVVPTKQIMALMGRIVRKKDHEFLFLDDREQRYEIFKGEKHF